MIYTSLISELIINQYSTQTIFEKDLLASEGTIIVDNVLKDGDSRAISEFNEMFLRDKNVHKVHVCLTHCTENILREFVAHVVIYF